MPASLVYSAEEQWSAALDRGGPVDFFGSTIQVPLQRRFGDLTAIERYCDGVLALPRVVAAFPGAGRVSVRRRAGGRRAHYEPATATIAIPVEEAWAAREAVVLHEVAHHLACSGPEAAVPGRRQWHGVRFRSVMCLVVEEVLGAAAALLLRTGYEGAGLRTVEQDGRGA